MCVVISVYNDMDEKDDPQRYGTKYRNERVKSRNLSEKKRRDQFNMLINELCSMVTSSSRKMDKSSVLRSAISFLRNHSEMSVQQHNYEVQENWKPSFLSNEEFTHLMLEALDGFIMVFSSTGKILYTSESIASLLGYLPSDICSSVFDMIHECDRSSLYKLINASSADSTSPKDSSFSILVHMKRGPILSQGTTSYELVRLIGTFHHWPSSVEVPTLCNVECDSNSCSSICSPLSSATTDWPLCFVAMARLETPQLLRVVNFADEPKNEFTSRHSLEWTFLFLDHRAPPIIGYLPFEVLGTSGYDYYHVDDLERVAAGHETLLQTGEGTSCFYRFLTKGQQWIWLQTRYFISYHQWSSKPEFVVCTNVVVSNEYVQNSLRKVTKKSDDFPQKVGFPGFAPINTTSNQSACLSPSPSASSLGSLSSDHSERCTANKSNSVLISNHRGDESPNTPSAKEKHFSNMESANSNKTYDQPFTVQPQIPSLIATSIGHSFIRQPVVSSEESVPFASLASIQSPFLGIQSTPPLNTRSMETAQCETSPSAQNPLVMTPSQTQLQDYLQKRHQLLQQQILLQQEELRRVSEQLMLVQFIGSSSSSIPYQSAEIYPNVSGTGIPSINHLITSLPQQLQSSHCSDGTETVGDCGPRGLVVSSNSCMNAQVPVYTSQAGPVSQVSSPVASSRRYTSSHSSQHSS